MKEIVDILISNNNTISTMESCTGGGVSNAITNIDGSSSIFKFGAVTYSNEYKIKMGVNSDIIDEYSVYSMETANEMSKKISDFTISDYGIGITGKINRIDNNNLFGEDNRVFISIYDRNMNKFYNSEVITTDGSRSYNKDIIINNVIEMLLGILK